MDLNALQATLRQFAAERDWQPFHNPKNLAMALMVEAAELAEIFQWMTPEQSQAAHADLVVKEQIADEVADVLLYLLQIADHTAVDLQRAVGRKLVKNANKHPPVRPGLPAGTAAISAVETHVLVDWENVQPKDSDIRSLVPDVTDVWLFHGPNQKGVSAHHASFGDRATPVKIARGGPNALDFHLSFYMGYIASRHPDARFVVMSNDKGYGPMLEHAAELGFSARQVGLDSANASTAKAAAKHSPAAKTAAAKKTTTAEKSTTAAKSTTAKKSTPAKKAASKKAAAKAAPVAKKTASTQSAAVEAAAAAVKTAPDSGMAQATSAEAPSATARPPAKQSAATKAVSAVKMAPTHNPSTATKALEQQPAKAVGPIDLAKAASHVLASLKKTTSRPLKQRSLHAAIKSLLGPAGDLQSVHAVLAQLLASGKVAVDGQGGVDYKF